MDKRRGGLADDKFTVPLANVGIRLAANGVLERRFFFCLVPAKSSFLLCHADGAIYKVLRRGRVHRTAAREQELAPHVWTTQNSRTRAERSKGFLYRFFILTGKEEK